jgi:hypothetical protein
MNSQVRLVMRPYAWQAWRIVADTPDGAMDRPGQGNSVYSATRSDMQARWWKVGGADYGRSIWEAAFNTSVISWVSTISGVDLLLAMGRYGRAWSGPLPWEERFALAAASSMSAGDCWDELTANGFVPPSYLTGGTGLLAYDTRRMSLVSGSYSLADGLPRHVMSWSTVPAGDSGEYVFDVERVLLELTCSIDEWPDWPEIERSYSSTVLETYFTDAAEYVAMTTLLGAPYSSLVMGTEERVWASDGVFDESGYFEVSVVWSFAIDILPFRWLSPWTIEFELSDLRTRGERRRTLGGVVLSVGDLPVAYAKFGRPVFGELARFDVPLALRLSLDRSFLTSTGAALVLSSVLSRGDIGVAGGRYLELYSADPRGPRQADVLARCEMGVVIDGFVRQKRGLWTNGSPLVFDPLVASGHRLGTHIGLKVGDELLMVVPLRDAVSVTAGSELKIQPGMLALRFT